MEKNTLVRLKMVYQTNNTIRTLTTNRITYELPIGTRNKRFDIQRTQFLFGLLIKWK